MLMGHLPGHLTELGIEQAKKLGQRLKDEKIDAIYSSDLARAADTAEEIAKFHPGVPLELTKELRERYLGEFQGRKKSEFGWTPKEYKATLVQPKDGEKLEDMFKRAESFLHKIFHKHQDDNTVLVAHNGTNKALIAAITGRAYQEIKGVGNLDNTSVSVFEIDEDRNHKIICHNCTKHLDEKK